MKNLRWLIIPVFVVALVVIIVTGGRISDDTSENADETEPETVIETEPETIVEETIIPEETEISVKTIRDGLCDMGILITEEYYFEDVLDYSSVKEMPVLNFKLGFTESSYLASYEGILTAGIDFSRITVTKDNENKTIIVTMPEAQVQQIDIDYDSFKVYEQKSSWFNPLSSNDFNEALSELESDAEQKAIDRGILEQANANGQTVVRQFIDSLIGDEGYEIVFN